MSPDHGIKRTLLQASNLIYSIYVWMKLTIHSLMGSKQKQIEENINEECDNTEHNEPDSQVSGDTVDFPVNKPVLQALEGVSSAIYKKCFSTWHCPPEEMKEQPLFKEVEAAIRGIYFNIKAKVRPLDKYEIFTAIANAFITHLKNFRKKRVTYRYKTQQEEVDFLRKQTKCLLLYWLPDSLRNSEHILVFLNEIISINVLWPSIKDMANSTFINETIVKSLTTDEVPSNDFETWYGSTELVDFCASSEPHVNREDSGDTYASDNSTERKKKNKRVGKKIKGMGAQGAKDVTSGQQEKPQEPVMAATGPVQRLEDQPKEVVSGALLLSEASENESLKRLIFPKPEGYSEFRSFPGSSEMEDTTYSTDGFTNTDSYDESEYENLISSVCDTILQKWLQENWTATICKSPTQDKHSYKICVSKEDPLSTKLWITERTVKDFRQIYKIICRNYEDFKTFTTLEKIEEKEIDEDSQFFQAIRINPDRFIDTLLELIKIHQNSELIFFFSPFEYEEARELFSEAFTYDTLSQEDFSAVEFETGNELCFRMFQQEKTTKCTSKDGSGSGLVGTAGHNIRDNLCSNEDNALQHMTHRYVATQYHTTNSNTKSSSVCADGPSVSYLKDYNSKTASYLNLEEENNMQKKKLEDDFLKSLYHLADELFAGGKYRCRFLHITGSLKEKSKDILAGIPKLYAEDQIVWYLNKTSELLLADACPLQVPPQELPSIAQELLNNKLQSLLTNKLVKWLFGKWIMKSITASHEAFQNSKANKETFYSILEDITKIITNGSK